MRRLVLIGWLLPWPALAAEPALPFAGAPGALPLEVALKYAGARLGSAGKFDYRNLVVLQDSSPPAFDQASLTLIRDGLNDKVKRGIRLRFAMERSGEVWTIRRVDEDFSCRNRPAWGTRDCPP